MSEQPAESQPSSGQLERARRLHDAISAAKRGVAGPRTPRSFTEEAAAEAARAAAKAKRER